MSQAGTVLKRHVPLRRCVACGARRSKRELVRIVRLSSGEVVVDPSGKRAGRGAYLCAMASCWKQGLTKGRLDHALHGRVAAEDARALLEFAERLAGQRQEPGSG